jgi:hypothetical protein
MINQAFYFGGSQIHTKPPPYEAVPNLTKNDLQQVY